MSNINIPLRKSLTSDKARRETTSLMTINITSSTMSNTRFGKNRKKKKKKKKSEKKEEDIDPNKDRMAMNGVARVILTAESQRAIACVIGEDVTAENPWTYIKKDNIIDNLDLHDLSSEFLPYEKEIRANPDQEILIGFIPEDSMGYDVFYLVYDTNVKSTVLHIIEQRKAELEKSLENAIWKPVGNWISLGSEKEIIESQIKNLRRVYEIDITSRYPVYNKSISFEIRNVEDVRDGYVELLPDERCPIENVVRKRIDAVVQASACTNSIGIQTNMTYPKNVRTDYNYVMEEEKENEDKNIDKNIVEISVAERLINEERIKRLNTFMSERADTLDDTLYTNGRINLHVDDYAALSRSETRKFDPGVEMAIIASFSDAEKCKNKIVSDCSWNTLLSGVVAVSYSNNSLQLIHGPNTIDPVNDTTFSTNAVLVWSYSECLYPKLYLEAPQDVVTIRFSPNNSNIIVGGLMNGQIVVWDLQNMIEDIDKVEVLTGRQIRNRHILSEHHTWMKHIYDRAVIKPVCISSLKHSHVDSVCSITFVNPQYEVTLNGKVERIGIDMNEHFVSASADGTIFFWNLGQHSVLTKSAAYQKRLKRLSKLPMALLKSESVYKSPTFVPTYRLRISESMHRIPILAFPKSMFTNYTAVDEAEIDIIKKRTYFKLVQSDFDDASQIPTVCSTYTGDVYSYTWEGLDYNTNVKSVEEQVKITTTYKRIHDGPIVVCQNHPHNNEVFLTIGGTIFAIWRVDEPKPLIWRKCQLVGRKYEMGGWIINCPGHVIIKRYDGCLEFWDLTLSFYAPTKIVQLGCGGGRFYGFLTPIYCRKDTYAYSNEMGALTVIKMPHMATKEDEDKLVNSLFERYFSVRSHLNVRMEILCTKYCEMKNKKREGNLVIDGDILIQTDSDEVNFKKGLISKTNIQNQQLQKMENMLTRATFVHRNEQIIFETMLARKNLNLESLRVQKDLLNDDNKEKFATHHKTKKIVANKCKIFEQAKGRLFRNIGNPKPRKLLRSNDDVSEYWNHIINYEELQTNTLAYIDDNPYHLDFNWVTYINGYSISSPYL